MAKAFSRVLAGVIIVLIVAAVAAAAYFASTTTTTKTATSALSSGQTTVSAPTPDTIIEENFAQPLSVDPATGYDTRAEEMMQNVYETLLFFKGDRADQLVPWLADSYNVSPDGLTYTFHLRSGITFSDGTQLDANAVYYSLMRTMIIDDATGLVWILLQSIRGAENYSKQYLNAGPSAPNGYGDAYTSAELKDFLDAKPIEVIDPRTVAIHLDHPYAAFPFTMTLPVAAIVSPTAFKAHWTAPTDGRPYIDGATPGDYHNQLNPWPGENMAGTGPYMLKSWDKASGTMIFARNEHYWGGPDKTGLAPVPNVVYKEVDDANTRVLDCKTGAADICNIPPTGGLIFSFIDKDTWVREGKAVVSSPEVQFYPKVGLWAQFSIPDVVNFNQKIRGSDGKLQAFQPFQDIRIRKAFALAFNRTAFIHDVLQGFGAPATQIVPPGMFGYDPTITPTPYDPGTAKALLIDAGSHPITPDNAFSPKNSKTVEIEYTLGNIEREYAATILANAINNFAADTGLYARVVGYASPQMLSLARTHQTNVFFLGWWVDYVDPDDFLVPFAGGAAGFFASREGYSNPNATRLIDQEETITDTSQRLQIIHQIIHMVNDDWAYCLLAYGVSFSLSRSWIHESPNATVASGVERYNQAIYGYYFYSLEKGAAKSPLLSQPLVLGQIQLLTTLSQSRKIIL